MGARKSRINFLQLLHAGTLTYTLNAHALSYLPEERLPKEPLRRLQTQTSATIAGVACWEAHLDALGIERERHRRIATDIDLYIETDLDRDIVARRSASSYDSRTSSAIRRST